MGGNMVARTSMVLNAGMVTRQSVWLRDLFLVVASSLLLALCAPLAFYLPSSPVPITIGAHISILIGAVLGPKRGFLAVMGYLLQGVCGLPVFAGGNAGLLYLMGSTGGYLIGYAGAAYITGYLLQRVRGNSGLQIMLSLALGNAIVYLFGVLHLTSWVGLPAALWVGFAPFVVGDILKLLVLYCSVKNFFRAKQIC